MKNRIVRCLILCCLLLPWAGGALAQETIRHQAETISYEELAQELRQVVEERVALEQRLLAHRAQRLAEKGKAIYQTVAGVMPPGLDSPEAIKAEIGALREAQTRLQELVQYAVEQQRWTRAVALQLHGYADEFRRIEQVNRIKTGFSMAMTTILEVAPIASTTKPAEIAAWAAEKLANETIKHTLDSSSDYYVRQLTGISQKAGLTTEALRRLWNVASESLAGIQSYLKENENKEISDPTALVLSRGRIIKEHLVLAEDSLIEFHKFFELQVVDGQNRLADIEALIGQLDKLTEDAQVSEKKAEGGATGSGDARQGDRITTETDLMRSIEELRRRETDIVKRLDRARHEGGQMDGKEVQALFNEFLTLDAAFFGRQGGYAAQAESVRDLLGRIAWLEAEAQKLEPALEQQKQKILEEFADKPKYSLLGDGSLDVPDRVALDNLADFNVQYYKHMDDRLQRRGALIADLGQAQLDLPEQWYKQPYDYLSYQTESAKYHRVFAALRPAVKAVAEAMAARYSEAEKEARARSANYPEGAPIEFDRTTYVVLSEDTGKLYRLIEQLTDAGQRYGRMPAWPFGGLEQAGAAVSTVVLDGLQHQQNRDNYKEGSIGIAAEEAHSREKARSFRAAAGLYLADVSRFEQYLDAYDAADGALQSSLDGLVGQGILVRQQSAGMVSYVLLGDQPADCRGIGKAMQAIGQGGEGLADKHRAAERAWQATLRGVGDMPTGHWSALNEPGMHNQLLAAERRTQAARDRRVAPVRLPDLSLPPLGGVVMQERFPKLWQGMQASMRDIDASVTVAAGKMQAASDMDAVDGAWLAAVKARPEQIEEDFDARLGCMASDSTLIASLRGKIDQLKTLRDSIGSKPESARRAPVDDPAGSADGGRGEDGGSTGPDKAQVQAFYQRFIDAYGRGDTRGLLALLAPDWQGGDGADLRDVEALLENSFRVFERIQYRISGFSVRPAAGRVVVSYRVKIVGEHLRLRLHHEEESDIVEEVGLIGGQPRILRTLSGSQWLR
ncbi:MAG: hypothetical protein ACK5JI_03550 [Azonexus sp.]